MPFPVATYRIQLRDGVDFAAVSARVDHLRSLGISTLYLSPIFKAVAGSTHGYDCVDPNVIDPVLGGEDGFRSLCSRLAEANMGVLLDIVPNHMGIGADNPYWQEMLRLGRQSVHASIFDVDWSPTATASTPRIALPFLGKPLPEIIAAGELEIDFANEMLCYHEHRFPLAPGTASDDLERTLAQQHWELMDWREGNHSINWRRFFDISGLAGVRIEDEAVFDLTHRKLFELLQIDAIQGLRIDHIDGLANPAQYLERLDAAWRQLRNDEPWIVIEKILAADETVPQYWRCSGTTGYETLNRILDVFIDAQGLPALNALWQECEGSGDFDLVLARAKRLILEQNLPAELNRLVRDLSALPSCAISSNDLREALTRLVLFTPRYRSYGRDEPEVFDQALAELATDPRYAAIARLLTAAMPASGELRRRFEQLTAPAMAKSLEDTSFYRYFPCLARNEVGGDPGEAPASHEQLHQWFADPRRTRPGALVTTATHDTKRGEDARIRLAMLTHPAAGWPATFRLLRRRAETFRRNGIPSATEISLILQTCVGAWPEPPDQPEEVGLLPRLQTFMQKALREAKLNSSWVEPSPAYEQTCESFLSHLLADSECRLLITSFLQRNHRLFRTLALGQLGLKLTLPGVPDFYQGTERFDFSLVDPDNRRPVQAIPDVQIHAEHDADSPLAKLIMARRLLAARAAFPLLFNEADYAGFSIGSSNVPLFAFERRRASDRLLVLIQTGIVENSVPMHVAGASRRNASTGWFNHVSNRWVSVGAGENVGDVFGAWPVAVLTETRAAG